MALEGGTYISDFVLTNPTGADDRSTADDHMRLIKTFIQASFPNITGAMNATQVELNYVVGVTSLLQTQLDAKQAQDDGLDDIAALAVTDGNFIVGDGTNWVAETPAEVRTSLGLGALALLDTVDTAEIADGAVTRIKMMPTVTGLNLVHSNDTSQNTVSTTYLKLKESIVLFAGVLSVSFKLSSGYPANPAFAKIYVNGIAVGTERTTTGTVTYTEDIIDLEPGDLIQVYGKLTDPATGYEALAISELRFYEGTPLEYIAVV